VFSVINKRVLSKWLKFAGNCIQIGHCTTRSVIPWVKGCQPSTTQCYRSLRSDYQCCKYSQALQLMVN